MQQTSDLLVHHTNQKAHKHTLGINGQFLTLEINKALYTTPPAGLHWVTNDYGSPFITGLHRFSKPDLRVAILRRNASTSREGGIVDSRMDGTRVV